MFISIFNFLSECLGTVNTIPATRKNILDEIVYYIQSKKDEGKPIRLSFLCTHNSRRSHFGQVIAAVAADYFSIPNVYTYSGGTETTQLNKNAVYAMTDVGFVIQSDDSVSNPVYSVYYDENKFVNCFSKVYNHPLNPVYGFAAIMTCSDADGNCPVIPGCEKRFSLYYDDPKISDGTGDEKFVYGERLKQVAIDLMYMFSKIR